MRLDVRMTDEAVVVLNRPVELKACARQILEPLGFVPELGGSFEQRSLPSIVHFARIQMSPCTSEPTIGGRLRA